ncbi:CarD family transcriptional regulator [Neobittarella massiliensis]|uniref:CarD family transcriptional regulator n=2 Tax=Oscillospiraceae TaxID=216572 RepID=A0A8J6M144_9FIRM|nr:CarD family transcriptional regulator [Neobittarella massiliensis]MBC3515791.1 CarD family transcriptional regulator [Neobittarella massiliensis]SCJ46073.1 CarD-like/TRCF domain [uncultured Anaerotruncus sp.]
MFQQNDTVLYGAQGVCRIAEISVMDLCGNKEEYYVLRPVYDEKSTIFVPAANQKLCDKMRRILSAEEIYALIRSMPDKENIWIEDENQRREAYRTILAGGDRVQLVQLIKTLYTHQQLQQQKGRKLHASDEHFMKEAERMLYEEFAHVLKIKPQQVLPLIVEQIEVEDKIQ